MYAIESFRGPNAHDVTVWEIKAIMPKELRTCCIIKSNRQTIISSYLCQVKSVFQHTCTIFIPKAPVRCKSTVPCQAPPTFTIKQSISPVEIAASPGELASRLHGRARVPSWVGSVARWLLFLLCLAIILVVQLPALHDRVSAKETVQLWCQVFLGTSS